MKPIDYFKKTFVLVFVFIVVSKLVFQLIDDTDKFTINFVIKISAVAFITALVMGSMNSFAKLGFISKAKQESKDNN
jgi:hypothetical protein